MLNKPFINEYPAYYETYIKLVSDEPINDLYLSQLENTMSLLSGLNETQANFQYAPGKWTLKEVIGHITDTERIMSYRLLRIARGDQTPLAGYDDAQYVREGSFNNRFLSDLLKDFSIVRKASHHLILSLHDDTWIRKGVASNQEISVRALAYIIAGHELHHVNIIKKRYLF